MDKEEDIVVNRGTIYAMREEITGYEKYKDAVLAIGDKLITDFTYMSSNIGSLFYRNKDKVLSIRSSGAQMPGFKLLLLFYFTVTTFQGSLWRLKALDSAHHPPTPTAAH